MYSRLRTRAVRLPGAGSRSVHENSDVKERRVLYQAQPPRRGDKVMLDDEFTKKKELESVIREVSCSLDVIRCVHIKCPGFIVDTPLL